MTPREVVLAQIAKRETPRVPYTLPFEEAVGLRLDQHYGGQAWRDRLVPYLLIVRAVETDIKVPIDEHRVRDGYGGIWRVDRRPWHLETPPLAEPTFAGYTFPGAEGFYRPAWKEEARRICASRTECFRVGKLGWGLFERSWNLRGFENALMDAAVEPGFFCEMLDRLTELYLEFVRYTVDLPVDAVMFGDDWGDQRGLILGADRWRRYLKPRWTRIYQAVHAAGKLVMTHTCGSVAEIVPDLIEMGLDVLEPIQPEAAGMDPYELKRRYGGRLTLWGGLGSQSLIPFGTPREIAAEVERLRSRMSRGGGYILAPAKPLQPETPTVNAAAVVDAFTSDVPCV